MIGRSDDNQPMIAFESIELVQEKGAIAVIDQGIEILKNQNARSEFSRSFKDSLEQLLGTVIVVVKALDVQAGNFKLLDQGPQEMGFAIARRPQQDGPASPRNSQSEVLVLRSKKSLEIVYHRLAAFGRQNQLRHA